MTSLHNEYYCLVGVKHAGKTTLLHALSEKHGYIIGCDTDELLLSLYRTDHQAVSSVSSLYKKLPLNQFHHWETCALQQALAIPSPILIATGGGIIDNKEAVLLLQTEAVSVIYLAVSANTAWQRISKSPLPAFLDSHNPRKDFLRLYEERAAQYARISNITLNAEQEVSALVQDFSDHVIIHNAEKAVFP